LLYLRIGKRAEAEKDLAVAVRFNPELKAEIDEALAGKTAGK